ncbi:MAG: HD domain-containing protein, partial [Minisyncoccia bacterium]
MTNIAIVYHKIDLVGNPYYNEYMKKDIKEIYELLQDKPKVADKKLLQKAYEVAEQAHSTQKRASGEPYFNHVFETAKNLARFGLDATTVAAG